MKYSFETLDMVKSAVHGGMQVFITNDEIPYYVYSKTVYNRTFVSITIGSMASLLVNLRTNHGNEKVALTIGVKESLNHADVDRRTDVYDWQLSKVTGTTSVNITKWYLSTTPHIGVSVGQSPRIFIEYYMPLVHYSNFKSRAVVYSQLSLGAMVQL